MWAGVAAVIFILYTKTGKVKGDEKQKARQLGVAGPDAKGSKAPTRNPIERELTIELV